MKPEQQQQQKKFCCQSKQQQNRTKLVTLKFNKKTKNRAE